MSCSRAAHRLADQLADVERETTKRFLIACADAATSRWRKKDRGIWEVRGDPQHFLYSKVMCWVALDCAINLAELLGAADRVEEWKRIKEEIWQTVVTEGWSDDAGAFTQCLGSAALDASNLMMPIVASSRLTTRGCSRPSTRSRTGLPTNTALCTATASKTVSTGWPVTKGRSSSAPSGSPTRSRWPARSSGLGACSPPPLRSSTMHRRAVPVLKAEARRLEPDGVAVVQPHAGPDADPVQGFIVELAAEEDPGPRGPEEPDGKVAGPVVTSGGTCPS